MVADRLLVMADALEVKPAPAPAPEPAPTGRTCADYGTGGGRVPSDGGRELRAGSACDACWGSDGCKNTDFSVRILEFPGRYSQKHKIVNYS